MQTKQNITRSIAWFAGIVISVIVIIFPLGYFFISYQYLAGNLEIEAEINARLITQIISANPEMWEFQQLRIQEYISHRPKKEYPEIRRVLNTKNELVAESGGILKTPLVMRSDELLDSGVVVGRIEIYRSLRTLLIQTGLVAIFMLPIGLGTFLILRNLPIRTISRAEDALQRSKEVAEQLASENAIMAEIGRIISATPNIEEVYPRFSEKVMELMPFDRIAINLINLKEGTHAAPYVAGLFVSGRQPGDVVSMAGTLLEKVLQSQKSIIIRMDREEEVAAEFPGLLPDFHAGFRSGLTVPLISGGEVIGGLALRSKGIGVYTDRDLRVVEGIGNQIAGAITNSQVYKEQRRVEEDLRRSEKKFKELFDNAPVGYHEFDIEGRITNINRTELEMLGYTFEERIGQFVWSSITEEEKSRQIVLGKLAGGIPPSRNIERTYRRKDGTTFPVLIKDQLLLDEKGRIKGIRSTIQDITERKHAEEEREKLIRELQEALAKVKTLSGLIPICASCKKIRDDKGYWNQIESYIHEHSDADFSHSICPDCMKKLYPDFAE